MPPDAGPLPELNPASVLLLSAEDSLEQTIKPRLEAADADTSRINALTAVRDGDTETPPVLPFHLAELETTIVQTGAKLVVVDPLMAYLDSEINSHRDQDIRRALHRFKLLAERTGVALVVVRHLNKMAGGSAIYRGGGSIGIIGAARSALLVGRDPSDPTACVIASVKSNLSRSPSSLKFRLDSVAMNGTSVGRIGWLGECDLTADDLVNRPDARQAKSKGEQCGEAIRELLADGEMEANELARQLANAGFSNNAIASGKRLAGVNAHAPWLRPRGGLHADAANRGHYNRDSRLIGTMIKAHAQLPIGPQAWRNSGRNPMPGVVATPIMVSCKREAPCSWNSPAHA